MKNYFYWKSNKQLWRESKKCLNNSQDLFVEEKNREKFYKRYKAIQDEIKRRTWTFINN